MFRNTLEKIKALKPDSLTVHTMAIKRASRLTEEMENYNLGVQYQQVADMVNLARKSAAEMDLIPYYLYRQKNILGNLENVGYSKKNKECLYNIQIMEERQSILACGAGAATKFVFPDNRIERAFNVKSVEEYIGRVDEMIERKIVLINK
jgi:oxygen-independent coproporphyrinogen-3 oxidase